MSASTTPTMLSNASTPVATCPMCSKPLAPQATSCPTCGWRQGMSAQSLAAPAAPVRKPANWSVRLRVGGVIVVVGLILGFVGWTVWPFLFAGGIKNLGDCYEVDLKAMSNFEMDQTRGTIDDIPKRFRELNNQRVVLDGEVTPNTGSTRGGTPTFDICYSVAQCCYSGPPKVQHFVTCRMPAGKVAPAFVQPSARVRVLGRLKMVFDRGGQPGGPILSVFQLDIEKVEQG